MEGQRTDKERVDYVVEHIEEDLQTNRALNGVDFSEFLGIYLTVCTGKRLYPLSGETPETLQQLAIFGLGRASEGLERELGKPVMFFESVKAGIAISQMSDTDEIDRVDEYASGLQKNAQKEVRDTNHRAMKYFSR